MNRVEEIAQQKTLNTNKHHIVEIISADNFLNEYDNLPKKKQSRIQMKFTRQGDL